VSFSGPIRFTLLGYHVGLAQPIYLALCAVAVLLATVGVYLSLARMERVRRMIPMRLIPRLVPGVSTARPAIRSILCGAGLFLFAIGLAQPQCGTRAELSKRRGVDLVVAIDASKSMLARDVQPNRLERAKLELTTLLDELKGDRVGIVAFAGDAFIQCPLTSDYAAAKMFLRAIDPEQMQQGGTNIAGALLLAKQVLENADRGSKERVVVLLSDGEDLAGGVAGATSSLRESGIRVFAVGIGSETGEPIPIVNKSGEVTGHKKDAKGEMILTRLDRASLAFVAQATDGELFYQPQAVAVTEVARRIDKLQKSELESRLTVRYEERFQYFVSPGLAVLTLGMAIRSFRRDRR
jgi:Ca-activated chloride channel family protein